MFSQFSPRHVRHPSAAQLQTRRWVHARRKVWRRENWPSCRETRCMSGHPCRAHHKLKWAREVIISPRGSVFASSTLREQYNNNRGKTPLTANVSPPTQTPQGQPCLTGVGNNPLIVIKPSQRAVSRMPKARRSRLSLTRCVGWAGPYRAHHKLKWARKQ